MAQWLWTVACVDSDHGCVGARRLGFKVSVDERVIIVVGRTCTSLGASPDLASFDSPLAYLAVIGAVQSMGKE